MGSMATKARKRQESMIHLWASGVSGLEWIATAQNGWHAVKIGSQVGWVSGEYSEITTE